MLTAHRSRAFISSYASFCLIYACLRLLSLLLAYECSRKALLSPHLFVFFFPELSQPKPCQKQPISGRLKETRSSKRSSSMRPSRLTRRYAPACPPSFQSRIDFLFLFFYFLLFTPFRPLSQAIEIDPTNHVYYSNRSAAYLSMGQASEALTDAERVMALNPDWPKVSIARDRGLISVCMV